MELARKSCARLAGPDVLWRTGAAAWIHLILQAVLAVPATAGPDSTGRVPDGSPWSRTSTASGHPWTLEELVREAIRRNVQVKISVAQLEEAEALFEIAASQAYPSGSVQVLFGGPTPEARLTNRDDISSLTAASREGDFNFGDLGITLRARANAVQPLYTFGKIPAAKKAARHLVHAARHQRTATRAEVAFNVTRAFWTCQLTRTFLTSLTEGQDNLRNVLEKIEDLLDADSPQVTENDRMRLKYALSTLTVRRTEAQNANEIALQALRLLLGWPQEAPLEVASADLDDLPEEPPSLESVVAWARSDRPELRAITKVREAAETLARFRRRQMWPDLFLGGLLEFVYTSNATDVRNPFFNDRFNFFEVAIGIGVRVELDVFQKLALLEQAEAQARVRAQQAELARQAVEFEIRQLHTEIANGYRRLEHLERANRTARGWLTSSTLGYDMGLGRADELIDAFLAWAASEADLQNTRFNTLLKLVDIARASGRLVGNKAGMLYTSPE